MTHSYSSNLSVLCILKEEELGRVETWRKYITNKRKKEQTISLGRTDQLQGDVTAEDGSGTINNWANYTSGGVKDAHSCATNTTGSRCYGIEVQHILAHQHHSTFDLLALVEDTCPWNWKHPFFATCWCYQHYSLWKGGRRVWLVKRRRPSHRYL